jgi:hypothetical protein
MRRTILLALALPALPLGGCAASIAAGAVGAAVRAADKPDKAPGEDPGPAARSACSARAATHGTVRIIDTVYKSAARLVVWGAVEGEGGRQSFRCDFDGKIVGFELKAVEPRRGE